MEFTLGEYTKTYDRTAATYYWPCMSLGIKCYVSTRNTSGKPDLRRHALFGLTQSILILSLPFKIVTMEIVPELPISEGYDNVLVVRDKLVIYANFVPTLTSITKKG